MESDFTIRNELDAVQPSAEIPEPSYSPNPQFENIFSSLSTPAPQYPPSNHFSLLREQQQYNYQITQQLISVIKWGAILGLIALILFATAKR